MEIVPARVESIAPPSAVSVMLPDLAPASPVCHETVLYRTATEAYPIDTHQPVLNSIRTGKVALHALGRSHYPGTRLAAGQLPGLLSLGFWDARGDQDWGMDLHRNEGVEISLLETGSMRFAVDHKSHPLVPGCLTITRPWQVHRQGDPHIAASRFHWVTIDVRAERPDQHWRWPRWVVLAPAEQDELARRLRRTELSVWRASPDVVHAFSRMAFALAQHTGDALLSAAAVGLNTLLLGLLEMLRAEDPPERAQLASREHAVELFLADLRGNLTSLAQGWTLTSMAAACGMGTTLFTRLCRRLTNDSPLRHLNRARLDAAARLLQSSPKATITSIAFECGFQSSQYFASQFHRRFAKSPSEFRRQYLPRVEMRKSDEAARAVAGGKPQVSAMPFRGASERL